MADNSTAVAQLVAARRDQTTIDRLPESCRPQNIEDALAIQRGVCQALGQSIGGWKCSMPAGDRIAFAPIYASSIFSSTPCPVKSRNAIARVEPEIAFVIGKDLSPRSTPYSVGEVQAAIAETRLVLELIGSRFADPSGLSFPEILADSLNNEGLFVGPVISVQVEELPPSFEVAVHGPEGALITREGHHPDGNPFAPVHWLANFLNSRREGLVAGQIVTTGSYCGVLDLPLSVSLQIRFGDLGAIDNLFSENGVQN